MTRENDYIFSLNDRVKKDDWTESCESEPKKNVGPQLPYIDY
jgi:hypothetical protein